MSAGLFFILGAIIKEVGLQYVWLSPKAFSIIFISVDFVSLAVQAFGGAKASMSFKHGKDPEGGAKIMVWGIILQIGECI